MNKDLIIQKQDELIAVMQRHLDFSSIGDLRDVNLIESLESELSSLKSAKEEVKSATNYIEIQEYTFDDYLKLEKETLVKLLMNCQKLLYGNQYASQFQSVQSKEGVDLWDTRSVAEENLEIKNGCLGLAESVKGVGERTAEEELPINRTIYIRAKNLDYTLFCEWFNTIRKKLESYKHSESKDMYPKAFVEWGFDNIESKPIKYRDKNGKIFLNIAEIFNHWSTVINR